MISHAHLRWLLFVETHRTLVLFKLRCLFLILSVVAMSMFTWTLFISISKILFVFLLYFCYICAIY